MPPLPQCVQCGHMDVNPCDFTPFYVITEENTTKSSKSNSPKNPTYENFGHLNQSIFAGIHVRALHTLILLHKIGMILKMES